MNDEEDLLSGGAGGDEIPEAAERAAGPGGASRDGAEEGFERGAAERAASRQDRREESRFSRLLRDRAILAQQNAELAAQLAAERAQRAKDRAEGYGAELGRAEREVADAVTAGDAEAIARANRRVAELAANRTAASIQAQRAAEEAEAARARREQPERPEPSQTTQAWVEANPWFGRDPRMTRQAQLLHDEAVGDEGLAPDTPEYWRFIEQNLDARFPGKVRALYAQRPAAASGGAARGAARVEDEGDAGEADPAAAARVPARAASGAAPVSRAAPGGAAAPAGQSIRLSAEAVSLAKAMGITPQQYAAHAARLAKRGAINAKIISEGA